MGDGCLLTVCSGGLSSVLLREKLRVHSLPIRKLILLGDGPSLSSSFNLNYFLRRPHPNEATLGVRLQILNFGGWI